jgi:hypothetical protein
MLTDSKNKSYICSDCNVEGQYFIGKLSFVAHHWYSATCVGGWLNGPHEYGVRARSGVLPACDAAVYFELGC